MPSSRFPPESEADRERWADVVAKSVSDALASTVITRPEVKAIAEAAAAEAAEKAITSLLEKLGLSGDDLKEFQRDQLWTRSRRQLGEAVARQGIMAVMTSLCVAIFTALVFWLKSGAPK